MPDYAYAEKGKVLKIVRVSSGGFIFPDKTSTGSIELYTNKMLADKYLYPIDDVKPEYDPIQEKILRPDLSDMVFNKTTKKVTATWVKESYSDSYIWQTVREKRNALLNDTDKYVSISDYPITDVNLKAMQNYRQKLRDLPNDYSDPRKVVWPDKPSV